MGRVDLGVRCFKEGLIVKLRNCPFCGSYKVQHYVEGEWNYVSCDDCGGSTGKYGDENRVVEMWNGIGISMEKVAEMENALTRIARWIGEFPETGCTWGDGSPMSYSAAYGVNGERDYMRNLALQALGQTGEELFCKG